MALSSIDIASPKAKNSWATEVKWGNRVVGIGGHHPVCVQSMTNTDTADAVGTAIQVKELAQAGSELVRITVNNDEAAKAVPYIREQLDRGLVYAVDLVADEFLELTERDTTSLETVREEATDLR